MVILERNGQYEKIWFDIFNLLLYEESPPFWLFYDFGNILYVVLKTSVATESSHNICYDNYYSFSILPYNKAGRSWREWVSTYKF